MTVPDEAPATYLSGRVKHGQARVAIIGSKLSLRNGGNNDNGIRNLLSSEHYYKSSFVI